jgi:hypothetical protein
MFDLSNQTAERDHPVKAVDPARTPRRRCFQHISFRITRIGVKRSDLGRQTQREGGSSRGQWLFTLVEFGIFLFVVKQSSPYIVGLEL